MDELARKLATEALAVLDRQIAADLQHAKTLPWVQSIFEEEELTEEQARSAGMLSLQSQLNCVWMASDGAPHYAMRHLIDSDPEQFGRLRFHGGSFHTVLECVRMCGTMFEVMLRPWIRKWRTSSKQQDYFLEPPDWTQTVEEMQEMLFGVYFAATQETMKFHQTLQVTPAQVWSHMLVRAAECPSAMLLLQYCVYADAIMVMVASESDSNFEMFRAA